jgi:outer membrane protein assembly factor BamE (lipoprotein component of BamABCDE complex)
MILFCVKSLFLTIAAATLLTGCASPGPHNLRKVDVGMEKAEVLEQIGNPVRTGRHQGQDRWTYLTPDNSETFIYFSEGKVTHVGSPNEPAPKFTPVQNPPEKFKPVGN